MYLTKIVVFMEAISPCDNGLELLDVLIGVISNLNRKFFVSSNNNPRNFDIYILTDCPWTKRFLKLLDSLHIKYNSFVITNDEEFINISNKLLFLLFYQYL